MGVNTTLGPAYRNCDVNLTRSSLTSEALKISPKLLDSVAKFENHWFLLKLTDIASLSGSCINLFYLSLGLGPCEVSIGKEEML